MRPLTRKIYQEFRRLDGARFYAYLTTTADAPTKDQTPYRTLLVRSKGIVAVGNVVTDPGGSKILLLEQPSDSEFTEAYRAYYISRSYEWQRRGTEVDPVSLVKTDNELLPMGRIWTHLEKPEVVTFEQGKETKYRFLTGEDVQVGDLINGLTVKRVYMTMGVKAVEVE